MMGGALQERGSLQGIARTFLALALLAERSAARSFPVRFLVLAILYRAETIARRFVARTSATLIAEAIDAGCPDVPFPDLACLDEPTGLHYGAADAALLALRLRILAAVLGMLSDAEDILDDRSAAFTDNRSASWTAVPVPLSADLPVPSLLVLVRLPGVRRLLRPPDTS
jgi:hypothetical protein